MNVILIISILTAHWICDYLLQSRRMAVEKSSNIKWLLLHVITYSSAMTFMLIIPLSWIIGKPIFILDVLVLFGIFSVPHLVVDFFTSKAAADFYKDQRYYWFFSILGLDQLLHYVSIFWGIDYFLTKFIFI